MSAEALIDRLAALPLFQSVPRSELEWLVERGEVGTYPAGTILHPPDKPITGMMIVLAGRAGLFKDTSGVSRKIIEAGPGHILGLIPYSRLQHSPGTELVEKDIDALEVHEKHFPGWSVSASA